MSGFIYCFAEYHYVECHYAECCYAECRYAEYRGVYNTNQNYALLDEIQANDTLLDDIESIQNDSR